SVGTRHRPGSSPNRPTREYVATNGSRGPNDFYRASRAARFEAGVHERTGGSFCYRRSSETNIELMPFLVESQKGQADRDEGSGNNCVDRQSSVPILPSLRIRRISNPNGRY